MKFDTPATTNPIDRMRLIGKPTDRIEDPLKTTGTAPYAYERHDVVPNQAYDFVVGATTPKGRVRSVDKSACMMAPGVIAVVSTLDVPKLGLRRMNSANIFGGDRIEHFHQAVAVMVAETFEQARAAAALVHVEYAPETGRYDLARKAPNAPPVPGSSGEGSGAGGEESVGNFEQAFGQAPVTLDATYTTPDETHAMMEPFARSRTGRATN